MTHMCWLCIMIYFIASSVHYYYYYYTCYYLHWGRCVIGGVCHSVNGIVEKLMSWFHLNLVLWLGLQIPKNLLTFGGDPVGDLLAIFLHSPADFYDIWWSDTYHMDSLNLLVISWNWCIMHNIFLMTTPECITVIQTLQLNTKLFKTWQESQIITTICSWGESLRKFS